MSELIRIEESESVKVAGIQRHIEEQERIKEEEKRQKQKQRMIDEGIYYERTIIKNPILSATSCKLSEEEMIEKANDFLEGF